MPPFPSETVTSYWTAATVTVPRVLAQPAPKALLLSYGDDAINYAMRFWIANPIDNGGISSDVNQAIWRAFTEHGIAMSLPPRRSSKQPSPAQSPAQP